MADNPIDFAAYRNIKAEKELLEKEVAALKNGDGGGTSGGMEARVARLESDMEHVKKGVDRIDNTLSSFRTDTNKGLADIRAVMSRIEERLQHTPSRWDVFLIFCAVLAAIGGIVALTARFLPSAG